MRGQLDGRSIDNCGMISWRVQVVISGGREEEEVEGIIIAAANKGWLNGNVTCGQCEFITIRKI